MAESLIPIRSSDTLSIREALVNDRIWGKGYHYSDITICRSHAKTKRILCYFRSYCLCFEIIDIANLLEVLKHEAGNLVIT